MDIRSIKQRLSLKNLCDSLLRVLRRFPLTIILLVGLTVLLSVITVRTSLADSRMVIYALYFLAAGFLISLSASLWGEEQSSRWIRWIVDILSVLLWGVYCAGLYVADHSYGWDPSPAFYVGNAAWLTAVVMLIPFGSFLREKDDLRSWHFLASLIGAYLIGLAVSWVMTGGLEGLLFGTAALFDFELNEQLPLAVMIICGVLLNGMVFLALIPQGERKHIATTDVPSFVRKSVSWLLLPMLGCYLLVLYAYGLTILVHWELPKGMISYLVSAVMAGYMLCFVLLYPDLTHPSAWQSRVLTRWTPMAILPLLLLMTVGIVRRFIDYGVTPPRLYLLTLLILFYAICITTLVARTKRFSWVALTFAALFLLSSGHPLNYYRLCRPNLTNRIQRVIDEKNLQLPLDLYDLSSCPQLSEDEASALYDDLTYMSNMYGRKSIEGWVKADSLAIADAEKRKVTSEILYYNSTGKYICPQGYATFRWINNDLRLPEDSLYGGWLHVGYQGEVLLFDTAAIRKAHKGKAILIVSSRSEKVAYAPTSITITTYRDHTTDIQYSGYLFTKSK
ncbi:MAG: DUF4153 domain-containing protein [Paludibacteraceae bacterium]|nr:DUF4153 domain-containing protein [Paludibacteraceae bacterium]